MSTDQANPQDIANRDYYNRTMVTRRVRAVVEADVEWREDDPDYCRHVAELEMCPDVSVRLRNPRVVEVEVSTGPAVVARPPAQSPHTIRFGEILEDGKDPLWRWACTCGQRGYAGTSIEADYWGKKHATASERIDELNEKQPASDGGN